MLNISGFLQKFLSFEKDNNNKISIIINAIKKETGIEIKKEQIEINTESIKINCSSTIKNEIFMHKNQIEFDLKSNKIFLKVI